jgi:hypothetical protein
LAENYFNNKISTIKEKKRNELKKKKKKKKKKEKKLCTLNI